jgi:hypothetical protein
VGVHGRLEWLQSPAVSYRGHRVDGICAAVPRYRRSVVIGDGMAAGLVCVLAIRTFGFGPGHAALRQALDRPVGAGEAALSEGEAAPWVAM